MDWPLSREEKKERLLGLYSQDVRAADDMLQAGEASMEKLRVELDALRVRAAEDVAAATRADPDSACQGHAGSGEASANGREEDEDLKSQMRRLELAVESAAALLRAYKPPSEEVETIKLKARARSAGNIREVDSKPLKPALSRTPRTSGVMKRRVSFGDKAETATFQSDSESEDAFGAAPRSCNPGCRSNSLSPGRDTAASVGTGVALQEPEPEAEGPQAEDILPEILPEVCAGVEVEKLGLTFKKLGEKGMSMQVRRVAKDSWAEAQGLLSGDRLLALNGRRSEMLNVPQFCEMMQARPLRLLIERGAACDNGDER
eukprot:TRINITY_DN12217_c0_g1_i1.p1 TRINITY_DN12217_c0_g1~~TRINITY_DN12217_c0_g1_i1.p1  ORF type:complete len:318 (+),score=79.96 TRINITY_DN12217_c0_g1_i1:50-1003(+)